MIEPRPLVPRPFPKAWLAILLLMQIGLVGVMMMGGSMPSDALLAFIQASEAQSAGNPVLATALREEGRQIIADEAARDRLIAIGLAAVSATVIGCIWMQKRKTIGE